MTSTQDPYDYYVNGTQITGAEPITAREMAYTLWSIKRRLCLRSESMGNLGDGTPSWAVAVMRDGTTVSFEARKRDLSIEYLKTLVPTRESIPVQSPIRIFVSSKGNELPLYSGDCKYSVGLRISSATDVPNNNTATPYASSTLSKKSRRATPADFGILEKKK